MNEDVLSLALWQHGVALGLAVLDIVARGARSSALLPVRLRKAMLVNCCGDAVAAVTPARAGGDPARFVWFTRSGQSPAAVLASFATEAVLNGVMLGGGAVLLSLWFAPTMWGQATHLVAGAVDSQHIGLALLVCAAGALAVVALRRRLPGVAARLAAFAQDSWRQFRSQPHTAVIRAAVWTLVSLMARTAILPVLLARTEGLRPTTLILGSVQAIYLLLLAPTPGGVGLVEGGFLAAFGHALGMGAATKLVVVWRAYSWLCPAGVGAMLLIRDRWRRTT